MATTGMGTALQMLPSTSAVMVSVCFVDVGNTARTSPAPPDISAGRQAHAGFTVESRNVKLRRAACTIECGSTWSEAASASGHLLPGGAGQDGLGGPKGGRTGASTQVVGAGGQGGCSLLRRLHGHPQDEARPYETPRLPRRHVVLQPHRPSHRLSQPCGTDGNELRLPMQDVIRGSTPLPALHWNSLGMVDMNLAIHPCRTTHCTWN